MSHKSIDSCALKLHSWKPFHIPNDPNPKNNNPSSKFHSKRPCLSDRATSFPIGITLVDEDRPTSNARGSGSLRLLAGKRRRRGSRSVSGRNSDRSANQRCCSVGGASAAYATCFDFPVAAGGTDSSGELFVANGGEVSWASDVSEARSSCRKERRMSFDAFSNDGDDLTRSNSRPFDDFDTNNGNTSGGGGYDSYGGIDDERASEIGSDTAIWFI